jgi:NAD-dependent SIR2 family protein deacetylase
VQEARALVAEAEVLLVVGTSLAVHSGSRLVRQAAEQAALVAVVNRGPSRADEVAALRIDLDCADALPALADALAR